MDVHTLEYAAKLFFAFCQQNPDLCPHDWSFSWASRTSDTTKEVCDRCNVCGAQKITTLIREEGESDYAWERRLS